MDRDKHWDRTQIYYKAITEENPTAANGIEIYTKLRKNITDEYLLPAAIAPDSFIKDNDSVFFFNFREDRMRQITESLSIKILKIFPLKIFQIYMSQQW